MKSDFEWTVEPLDAADERLVDAYRRIGVSLDALAYTDEFDKLCEEVSGHSDRATQRATYKRLLSLRKRGRLPRVYDAIYGS
jgi:hypothetical protein